MITPSTIWLLCITFNVPFLTSSSTSCCWDEANDVFVSDGVLNVFSTVAPLLVSEVNRELELYLFFCRHVVGPFRYMHVHTSIEKFDGLSAYPILQFRHPLGWMRTGHPMSSSSSEAREPVKLLLSGTTIPIIWSSMGYFLGVVRMQRGVSRVTSLPPFCPTLSPVLTLIVLQSLRSAAVAGLLRAPEIWCASLLGLLWCWHIIWPQWNSWRRSCPFLRHAKFACKLLWVVNGCAPLYRWTLVYQLVLRNMTTDDSKLSVIFFEVYLAPW